MTSLKHLDLKSVPCTFKCLSKLNWLLEKLSKNEQLIVELDKGETRRNGIKQFNRDGMFV